MGGMADTTVKTADIMTTTEDIIALDKTIGKITTETGKLSISPINFANNQEMTMVAMAMATTTDIITKITTKT